AFFTSAALPKLEVLNLDGTGAGDKAVEALARSALGELRILDLQSNQFGQRGLAALAASTKQPHLHGLDVSGLDLPPGSLRPLSGSPLLNRLVGLRLHGNNQLVTADLGGLLGSSSFSALRELALGSVKFSDEGAQIVAGAQSLRGLTELSFT